VSAGIFLIKRSRLIKEIGWVARVFKRALP